jgi:glycosyltransferase involved in cell wall biosynthesis
MNTTLEKFSGRTPSNALFSIMIPSWNNLAYLQLCINSIRKHSVYPHQIIVHINEGKDGSLDWIKTQADISYSFSKENIGVCYALNSCRNLASTEYLLYMNDDMYVCPGWDKPIKEEIDHIGHKYFFFSATAIEIKAQSNCSIEKSFGNNIESFNEAALIEEYSSISMQDWQGSTWPPNIVHKDIWDLAGGYSIEFSPGMYSDPDFSMKLWKLGVRTFKGIASSRVYHFGSISVKRVKHNAGYSKFISKWGMTSGTFSKYFLRRGDIFDGPLQELPIPWNVQAKNYIKRIFTALTEQ